MKLLLRLSLLIVVAAGVCLTGCSADSQRIVTSSPGEPITQFSIGNDWPTTNSDLEDYISQGYYYPEDDGSLDGWNPEGHDNPNNPSDKPIDNGLGTN